MWTGKKLRSIFNMIDIQYKSKEDLDIEYDPKFFKNASNLMMWCFYVKMPDQITLTSTNERENANYECAVSEIISYCESKDLKKPKITLISSF